MKVPMPYLFVTRTQTVPVCHIAGGEKRAHKLINDRYYQYTGPDVSLKGRVSLLGCTLKKGQLLFICPHVSLNEDTEEIDTHIGLIGTHKKGSNSSEESAYSWTLREAITSCNCVKA